MTLRNEQCEGKDMIGRQEVPAEHLIGQGQVALKDARHLSADVLAPAELLQDLHGHCEDLTKTVLLKHATATITMQSSSMDNHTYAVKNRNVLRKKKHI